MGDWTDNDETIQGYLDGLEDNRVDLPESLANRGAAYVHGWLNGRDDRIGKPRTAASTLRRLANEARRADDERAMQ